MSTSQVASPDCGLAGLCDGTLLDVELSEDLAACIYFCRETQVDTSDILELKIYKFRTVTGFPGTKALQSASAWPTARC